MHRCQRILAPIVSLFCAILLASAAHAQRTDENAVTDADDAFGTNIGLENTGIYTERNARGFSPLDAGNVRIEGIYFDQVTALSGRLRDYTAIRVGFSAVDFPFVAPTGVVDNQFNPFPKKFGNSITLNRYYYGGHILEWDLRAPIVEDKIAITGGLAKADTRQTDGANQRSWGLTFRPIIRLGDVEIAPFTAVGTFTSRKARPLVVVRDGYLPQIPGRRQYLGPDLGQGQEQHREPRRNRKGKACRACFVQGRYLQVRRRPEGKLLRDLQHCR